MTKYFQQNLRLLFCFIPIGLLAFVLYKNLINIPSGDDIYVLEMFSLLPVADSWWNKLNVLFQQHNEHRLFLTKAIAYVQYKLVGSIDLRWWSILGNLSLFGILAMFYQRIGTQKWWLIPITFLILAPASNTLTAMQNSNSFTVVFALAAFYFSVEKPSTKHTALVFLCSWLSIFSNSGGIATLIIISAVFFFQKRYLLLGLWLLWSSVIVVSYYWTYQMLYRHPSAEQILHRLPEAAFFYVAFVGSIGLKILPTGAGIIALGGIAVWKKYYRENPFLFLCIVYGLLTAAMTTYKRYEYGVESAITERYRIYSMILLSAGILLLRDFLPDRLKVQRLAFWGCLLMTVGINLKHFKSMIQGSDERKEALKAKIENYYLNNSGYNCFEVTILNNITKQGVYNYSLTPPLHNKSIYDNLNRFRIDRIRARIARAYQTADYVFLEGKLLHSRSDLKYIGSFVHQFIIIHPADTPFTCAHNELVRPQNNKSIIINIDLDNSRRQLSLPTIFVKVPKKHFQKEKQYALSFMFMTDTSVNHPPLTSNIRFHL